MIVPVLNIEDGAGNRRFLEAGACTTGFIETGRYLFDCTDGLRLVIDDIELPRSAAGFHWSPGFYAGRVEAEVLRADGECVASYQLDVSPTPDKLGHELFEVMLRDLATFAPDLLLGSEAQQALFDPDESPAPPEVQYARLRRYAQACCVALQHVSEQPITRPVRKRHLTPIHRLRRLDARTALAAARSPLVAMITNQGDATQYAAALLDAPTIEDTLDNEANRTLGWMLRRLQHRVAHLADWLDGAPVGSDEGFDAKRARRSEIVQALQVRLRRLARREPFRSVTRLGTSSAGLTAIAAHPAYARAQRYIWLALQEGVGSEDAAESLPISPTWQVYERWCYLCTTELMRQMFPDVEWRQTRWGKSADQLRCHGRIGQFDFAVWLQPRFAPWDQASRWRCNSLSGERFPDITLTLDGPDGSAFMVLDAKYRASRTNVLDAMTSAHLYHDSLTWRGNRPWRSLLLVPRTDHVPWLADSAFQATYGIGAVALARRDCTAALREALLTFVGANGGP
ncbi:MAG TPA: DUF2357 domain-containing protein [Rhodanobacteraceae bacterium]|nr:DUF2357 domain-containing protein [Rhodanobacteraceae bacterium]